MDRTSNESGPSRGRGKFGASCFDDGNRATAFLDVSDFEDVFSGLVEQGAGFCIFEFIMSPGDSRKNIIRTNVNEENIRSIHTDSYNDLIVEIVTGAGYFAPACRDTAEASMRVLVDSGYPDQDSAIEISGEDALPEMRFRILIPFAGPAGRVCFVEYLSATEIDGIERETLINKTLFYLMGKLHAAGRGPAEQLASLSPKELECLRWAADGKTSSEISIITGLSEHTVNHYLIFACNKLNAVNRAHAVAKAIRAGII